MPNLSVKSWMTRSVQAVVVLFFCITLHAQEPLVIGLDADMSSVAAEGGIAIQQGASLAIDEINSAGGVLGRPLVLEVTDHRGNPARGQRNITALSANDNLVAILGGVHTPVVLQELERIHENKLLFLVPWAAGTAIIDNGYDPNFVFRVSVRDAEAANVILGEIARRNIESVALVLERTGWGRSNEQSMTAVAKQLGISISTIAWINWRQSSFDDEALQIASSGAQAIVLVTNAPEGAVVMDAVLSNPQLKRLPVVSHWGIAAGNFVERLGVERLNNADISVLQTFHFAHSRFEQRASSLFSAYQQMFGSNLQQHEIKSQVGLAHAYDLVHLLALAIEQAKSTDMTVIREALKNLEAYDGAIKDYRYPFQQSQDALWSQDYILTTYDADGNLIPRVNAE